MPEMTVPDDLVALFHQMRALLEEILAADTRIAASSFEIIYLTASQLGRIRSTLLAGEAFSPLPSSPAARGLVRESD